MILGVLSMSGCALSKMARMSKDQGLTVEPSPLEVHGNEVKFTMSANLPVKMLKPKKVYTLNTYYQYGTQEKQLAPVVFNEKDFPNASTEQPKASKEYSFAYDPAMSRGNLLVQGVASNPKTGNFVESEKLIIAEGLITTSTLVQPSYFTSYAPHGYNDKEELIPTNVEFFFEQGRSVLRPVEKNSDRGSRFAAFIAEKNATKTVTITGTHSPEGKDRINADLAKERAVAIETWYREQMDKYDYQGMASQIRFITKPVVDDWNELKAMLSSYNGISSAQKSEWTNIINGSGSFEQKEKQLQKLSTYKQVFKDIYPQLRTAKTEVLTIKPKKSREEIISLAKSIAQGRGSADQLSAEELAYAASFTPSLEEKKSIYEAAAKKNDTWAIHNNLGAVSMEMAMAASGREKTNMLRDAINHFEISNQKNANVHAQANLGMAQAMQNNNQAALDALNKALTMNPGNDVRQGVNGAKGAIEIKMASYDAALSSLGNATNRSVDQYNKGMAQFLKGDFRSAQSTFETVISNDRAFVWAHYLAAVAAARQGNENKVIENLRNAVNADASLKAKALSDLEFREFSGNQAFIDILK
ncbi:outer membrane lipoprotein p61 [Roseivirga seohaensis subsp. aquiponti]|uniref:Outer membrane lipoprotein p61 n=1 Tax=Roseivirga seohaensis subsp. aquiponti TaxID=1566026 RepID=A0A0L8AMD7_9BACT|nr:outer membrane lipoprotein p61 [Roseivirga seohaensis subsp. aquiponti]